MLDEAFILRLVEGGEIGRRGGGRGQDRKGGGRGRREGAGEEVQNGRRKKRRGKGSGKRRPEGSHAD